MISLTVSNKSFGSYLSLSKNLFTLSCDTFSNISANLQHPPCFGTEVQKQRVMFQIALCCGGFADFSDCPIPSQWIILFINPLFCHFVNA